MDFHTKYSNTSPRPKLKCGPGKTDQSFKRECDVDRILYKYTHHLPLQDWQMRHDMGTYADVSQMPKDPAEYKEWADNVSLKFGELPAELRRAYGDNAFAFASALAQDSGDLQKKVAELVVEDRKRMNPDLYEKISNFEKKLDALKPVETKSVEGEKPNEA